MRIIVAITGASGVVIGKRLLEELEGHEVHLIISNAARKVIWYELGEVEFPATEKYTEEEIDATIASSSFSVGAMAIAPCSMKTLSAVAHGYTNNLIIKAAENILRTGKTLAVVPRETPLSLAAINNMRELKLSGAVILPPVITYYNKPKSMDEVTDFFVGKILDILDITHKLYQRWENRLEEVYQEGGTGIG